MKLDFEYCIVYEFNGKKIFEEVEVNNSFENLKIKYSNIDFILHKDIIINITPNYLKYSCSLIEHKIIENMNFECANKLNIHEFENLKKDNTFVITDKNFVNKNRFIKRKNISVIPIVFLKEKNGIFNVIYNGEYEIKF